MPKADRQGGAGGRFFEIVNYKRAQSRMPKDAKWMKLYTSLLDHDGFESLTESNQLAIMGIWLLAARLGRDRLPADPKWLRRKIGFLKAEPDLEALAAVCDSFGQPQPFIRFCAAPLEEQDRSESAARGTKGAAPKRCACGAELPPRRRKCDDCKGVTARARCRRAALWRARQKERERQEEREEQRREKERRSLTASALAEREREKKTALRPRSSRQRRATQKRPRAEKPRTPKEAEPGSARRRHAVGARSGPTPSEFEPDRVGRIIKLHWLDPEAEAFGWAICEALGLSTDKNDPEARREWGTFAAAFEKQKLRCGPGASLAILEIGVRKADELRRHAKRHPNRGALWVDVFHASCAVHLASARAPPA